MSRSRWPESPGSPPLGDGRFACGTRRPTSIEELCSIVREEAAVGGAIYPQGGGTSLHYGGTPARPGIAVDVRSLNQIVDYPHADMTITVQAGMSVSTLQETLAEHHQRLLFEIPDPVRATIGGALATAACGPRRYGLGRPRDSIIGVSFVTSAGVEVKGGGRVVKNVAGYDFPKLLTGSLGSLGVITQATLKVRPMPSASALIWLPVDRPETMASLLIGLNASPLRPVAFDFLNPSAATLLGRPLSLAEGRWTLVVGIEDADPSVGWQVDRYREECGVAFEVLRDDATMPLWKALSQFRAEPAGLVCSANLRPSRVASFMAELPTDRWALQAHAGNGVVHMRGLGEWTEQEAATAVDAARASALREGGNLVVAQCPPPWKPRLKVWGAPRADWALGRAVKKALDPIGLMNPGRFAGED